MIIYIIQIKSDSSFNGGESNDAPEYYQSVWIFPVIISCLIAVAVALVQVFFFGHFDQYLPFKSPGPEPLSAVDETRSGIAIWTHKVEKSRRFYVILFLSTLGVLLVSLHSLFLGNYFVATGIKTFDDGLRNFETIIFNGDIFIFLSSYKIYILIINLKILSWQSSEGLRV